MFKIINDSKPFLYEPNQIKIPNNFLTLICQYYPIPSAFYKLIGLYTAFIYCPLKNALVGT